VSHARTNRRASPLILHHDRYWSPVARTVVIAAVAIVMGSLFLISYSLALGDPMAHRIDAALIGDGAANARTVDAVEGAARDSVAFSRSATLGDALHALHEQQIYAVLDAGSARPTLYVASAAGASVARVLEKVSAVDPAVRVVDTHPLAGDDPSGLDLFYRMLVATIIGFLTVFQVSAHAGRLDLRRQAVMVLGLAVAASFALTLIGGVLMHGWVASDPEQWGILALHILAVASFASLMGVLLGRWALLPTWLFFVIVGNTSSGGAVAPPLLPAPLAFISQWLPSGATVTSLRDAMYFADYQHVRPLAVVTVWAAVLFAGWLVVAHRRGNRMTAQSAGSRAMCSAN
jgi:hypothetical protein